MIRVNISKIDSRAAPPPSLLQAAQALAIDQNIGGAGLQEAAALKHSCKH